MTTRELKMNDGKHERISDLKQFKDMSLVEMSQWFHDHPAPEWDRPLPNDKVKTPNGEVVDKQVYDKFSDVPTGSAEQRRVNQI